MAIAREAYLGKVLATEDHPAHASEFWFIIEENFDKIQVGSYVVISSLEGNVRRKILGVIEDMDVFAPYQKTPLAAYRRTPQPTETTGEQGVQGYTPTLARCAKVKVVKSIPPVYRPPSYDAPVFLLGEDDVELLHAEIPKDSRVVLGFMSESLNPHFTHADFLLGPEAAHINISGKSGMATKTSYAWFLAISSLSWCKRHGYESYVVMFNVKGYDLMRLHEIPEDWLDRYEEVLSKQRGKMALSEERVKLMSKMWKKLVNEFDIHPEKIKVKYFTYPDDPFADFEHADVKTFKFGLADLDIEDIESFLFDPTEQNVQRQQQSLFTYLKRLTEADLKISFNDMLEDFRVYSIARNQSDMRNRNLRTRVRLDSWHTMTMGALYRKLDKVLRSAERVVEKNRPESPNALSFDRLASNAINIVQLVGLSPEEKRLTVSHLLRSIQDDLSKDTSGKKRVLVMVDELNKYAPAKGSSPIQWIIRDVAERGRYIGLSLMGCQQFASSIDINVYENSSLKAVGRTEHGEARAEVYKYLGELRERLILLRKGEFLIYHPFIDSPMVVEFPVPPYLLDFSLTSNKNSGVPA